MPCPAFTLCATLLSLHALALPSVHALPYSQCVLCPALSVCYGLLSVLVLPLVFVNILPCSQYVLWPPLSRCAALVTVYYGLPCSHSVPCPSFRALTCCSPFLVPGVQRQPKASLSRQPRPQHQPLRPQQRSRLQPVLPVRPGLQRKPRPPNQEPLLPTLERRRRKGRTRRVPLRFLK